MNTKLRSFGGLLLCILICEMAGVVGSLFTVSAIRTWYQGLIKPALNPPSWVFGPVWTVLYALMGIAVFLIWKQGWERREVKTALRLFAAQLVVNALWSILFFGMHNPLYALIDICVMWLLIVFTIIVFYRIAKPAAFLLLPYICWVSFALYLNYAIYSLNR